MMATIKVRVMGDKTQVEQLAKYFQDVTEMTAKFNLVDKSEPYECRNPKEARVYLTFVSRDLTT